MQQSRCAQKGSSLIEVVVALFVLAIGLLGVLSMQVKSVQFNQSAYYYSQAAFLANQILESMRADAANAASYVLALDDATPAANKDCSVAGNTCSAQELRAFNLKQWRAHVEKNLVSGKAAIGRKDNFYTITIQFDDSRSSITPNAQGQPELKEFTLVTEI